MERLVSSFLTKMSIGLQMFVRLFVDENLDRMVPISRQPREKVQAIIDSCLRQFPEFGERARKRIRTYLKSCRRNKRSRESSVPDTQNRPMPPHLTSAAAEQILAQACENENQNAKRLRIGLEPISQPLPVRFFCSFFFSFLFFSFSLTLLMRSVMATTTMQLNALFEMFQNVDKASAENAFTPSLSPTQSTLEGEACVTPSAPMAASRANLFRPAFGPYQRSPTVTLPSSSSMLSNHCGNNSIVLFGLLCTFFHCFANVHSVLVVQFRQI